MKTSRGRRMGVLAGAICLATTGLAAAGATAVLGATPAGALAPTIPCPAPVYVGLTATVTCPFIAPGTNENPAPVQTWTPPAGVSDVRVTAYGGAGGSSDGGGTGGTGGAASYDASLQPGQVLTIIVGGSGGAGNGNSSANGGYGGAVGTHVFDGGSGGSGGPGNGAGGGGASSVNFGNGPQVVGAGGGGGGASYCGNSGGADGGGGGAVGGGGGADGAPGSALCAGSEAGGGGTQSVGGAAGGGGAGGSTAGTAYFSGTLGVGGNGGSADRSVGAGPTPAIVATCPGLCIGGGGGGGGISGGGGGGATGIVTASGTAQPTLPVFSGGGGGGGASTVPFPGSFPACPTCTGDGKVVITYQPIGTNPTTTTLVSSNNPSGVGEAVTYTATVAGSIINTAGPAGAPTSPALVGTVAFTDGGETIPGCGAQPLSATVPDTATCTVTYQNTRGSPHPIAAHYSGDPTFAQSASTVLSQVVAGGGGITVPTSITLTSSPNPSTGGEVVTYTATISFPPSGVGSPTGSVTFFDNGVPIPGCIDLPVGGSPPYTVSCSATYGPSSSIRTAHVTSKTTHLITASYSGNSVFGPSTTPPLAQTVLGSSGQPTGFGQPGYRLVASDGGVFSFGGLPFFGSMGGKPLNQPIVGMESPDGGGYWLVASDGGVFAFGDAGFFGSTGGMKLNKPIVGMATTPDGQGYWLVASDGGIFAFGDASFYGSTGAMALNKPVVGMASTVDGGGYWLVASDGGIFAFGDAGFYGSTGAMSLNKPIVGMAPSDFPTGYWLVASDGGIFAFGGAGFFGSTGAQSLNKPIVGMAAALGGGGYWLAASDGGVFAFGAAGFAGSMGGTPLNQPIVGINAG